MYWPDDAVVLYWRLLCLIFCVCINLLAASFQLQLDFLESFFDWRDTFEINRGRSVRPHAPATSTFYQFNYLGVFSHYDLMPSASKTVGNCFLLHNLRV